MPEALELLRGIRAPLFGVPGNHEYWAGVDFSVVARAFAATGRARLMDEAVMAAQGKVNLVGLTCRRPLELGPKAGVKNILLLHSPAWVENVGARRFDLMLAGHSHGGQVRLPFVGPLVLPSGVGPYDLALFRTSAGLLYVGAGIGWFYLNVRFRCSPELTVVGL